jgi:hypothetical protein
VEHPEAEARRCEPLGRSLGERRSRHAPAHPAVELRRGFRPRDAGDAGRVGEGRDAELLAQEVVMQEWSSWWCVVTHWRTPSSRHSRATSRARFGGPESTSSPSTK